MIRILQQPHFYISPRWHPLNHGLASLVNIVWFKLRLSFPGAVHRVEIRAITSRGKFWSRGQDATMVRGERVYLWGATFSDARSSRRSCARNSKEGGLMKSHYPGNRWDSILCSHLAGSSLILSVAERTLESAVT